MVAVAARSVTPKPDMVPPDQLRLVVTVSVSEPVRVPPEHGQGGYGEDLAGGEIDGCRRRR